MNLEKRKQLESRLSELDSALASLRRGFARVGKRPPDVCALMQSERAEIAKLLKIDSALGSEETLSWSLKGDRDPESNEREPTSKASQEKLANLWNRVMSFFRRHVRC